MTTEKSASALWFGVAAMFGIMAVGCNSDTNLSALFGGPGASSPSSLGSALGSAISSGSRAETEAAPSPDEPMEESQVGQEGAALAEEDGEASDGSSLAAVGESSEFAGENAATGSVSQPLAAVSADQLNQMAASVGTATAHRGTFTPDELEGINRPGPVPDRQQADSSRVPEKPATEVSSTLDQPASNAATNGSFVQSANVPRPGADGTQMVRTTAYCHKEADSLPYGTLTAAGTQLQFGNVVRSAAADWSVYPMGTKFRIVGLPYTYVVDDYGSALAGTRTLDIYKPTLSEMHRWGVRNVPIQIIQWGSYERSAEILHGRRHVPHADHVRQMLRSIEQKGYTGHRRAGARA